MSRMAQLTAVIVVLLVILIGVAVLGSSGAMGIIAVVIVGACIMAATSGKRRVGGGGYACDIDRPDYGDRCTETPASETSKQECEMACLRLEEKTPTIQNVLRMFIGRGIRCPMPEEFLRRCLDEAAQTKKYHDFTRKGTKRRVMVQLRVCEPFGEHVARKSLADADAELISVINFELLQKDDANYATIVSQLHDPGTAPYARQLYSSWTKTVEREGAALAYDLVDLARGRAEAIEHRDQRIAAANAPTASPRFLIMQCGQLGSDVPLGAADATSTGHANAVVVDHHTRRIVRVEPGFGVGSTPNNELVLRGCKELFAGLLHNGYTLDDTALWPSGMQMSDVHGLGRCVTWSLFCSLMIVLNPDKEPRSLFQYMLGIGENVGRLLDLFLFYVYAECGDFGFVVDREATLKELEFAQSRLEVWRAETAHRRVTRGKYATTDGLKFLGLVEFEVIPGVKAELTRRAQAQELGIADATMDTCVYELTDHGDKLVLRVLSGRMPLQASGPLLTQLLLETLDPSVYGTFIHKVSAAIGKKEGCAIL